MRKILIILTLILSFSIISCKSSDSNSTQDNETTPNNSTTLSFDNETTLDNTTNSSGLFVAVGYQEYLYGTRQVCCRHIGKILKSSNNGDTWEILSFSEESLNGISYVNNTFMVGLSSIILTSSDGLLWSAIYYSDGPRFTKFFYGNGTYLAPYCTGLNILKSNDGTTWETTTGTGCILGGVYANNKFVVGGVEPKIYTSTDYGNTWNMKQAGAGHNITDIIYADNNFVATTSGGTILFSSDNGENWTESSTGISDGLNSIVYVNSKFIAVGYGGKIITTSDAVSSWNESTSGTTNNLTQITYGNGTFVVVGNDDSSRGKGSSIILTSTDNGSTWESMFTSVITNRLRGVTFKQ